MKKSSRPAKGGVLPTTRKVSDILQARYTLVHGETFVKSVFLSDCNPSPIRAGKGFDLDTLNSTEDVTATRYGVEKLNFTLVAFKV